MRFKIIGKIFLSAIFLAGCTLSYVKDDTLKSLEKKYEGVYVCTKDLPIGNDEFVKSGTRVRLYFQSGTNSLKVYAYPFDISREQSIGKNILYLFDTDFPDNKFEEVVLDSKLKEIVKKVE
ncbi:MAG: type II secretion system-associated lipoprotein [Spirochaetia bacterium]|nr:type II secretion system-associated lipoprotein [Spirochaetia bacterium]